MKDALGHGSNAHNAGIDSLKQVATSSIRLHPNVLRTINKNPGGFSVRPGNGKSPVDGYMVSIPGHSQIVNEADLKGPSGARLVNEYAQRNASQFANPNAHIGGWTDHETGKTHLDVSYNIKSRSGAVKTGQANNQIAIWDVKRGRELRTGGSGD